jgi:hypothetical protein
MSKIPLGSYVAWAWDPTFKGIVIDVVINYEYDKSADVKKETCYQIRWNNHVTKEFCDETELILLSEAKSE